MSKNVMILHPMTGDLEGNTAKVVAICREIHSREIIPVFPSFTTRRYLTEDLADRELARVHIRMYFDRGFIDEVWLFGDRITSGMWREIEMARVYGVRMVPMTPETKAALSTQNSV